MKKGILIGLCSLLLFVLASCGQSLTATKVNGDLELVGVSGSEGEEMNSSSLIGIPTSLEKGSEPLKSVGILKSAYGKGPNGENVIFAGTTGNPSVFNIIDAITGEKISTHELKGAPQVWGMITDPTGDVYFSAGANLYRYISSEDIVVNLGKPIDSEKVVWHITTDDKGRIYGTSYPNGKVFMYDPESNDFTDYGTILEGQQYTRSIATYKGKVYVGTGTEAHLMVLDPDTRIIKEINLPKKYSSESFVYDLDIVDDYLYARVTDSATLLVYDLNMEKWIEEILNVKGISVSPASEDGLVYFNKDDELYSYNPKNGKLTATGFEDSWGNKGFGWIELDEPYFEGQNLISTLFDGRSWIYNPISGAVKFVNGKFEEEPIVIQSIETGPDKNLYMSGYLSGGLASYSPEDNMLIDFGSFGQTENMVSTDQFLYLGVYTKSVIYKYDPTLPFDFDRSEVSEAKNPKKLFSLDAYGQDRPFGMEQGDGKVYIGTVPSYGQLGGALTIYDEKTDKYEVYRNIVSNQSIVSLQYHGGLVYGSTSIFGGLGTKPTEEEAKIFIFDPIAKEKIYEGVPLPGEKAISTLEFDDDGNLWGMSPGKIFKFDVEQKKIIHSQELFFFDWKGISNYWIGAEILHVKGGLFYGVTQGNLFSYDSRTEKMEVLSTGVSLIEADNQGQIFATKGTKLYRYVSGE